MKVLQVNCVYNHGSTGKLVYDLANYLTEHGHQSVVCYGRGVNVSEPNVYKVSSELEAKIHSALSRAFGVQFAHSPLATNKLLKIIENEKPDVVHLHCLNGHFVNVYRLLEYLKKNKIKTVLTLHAEIMHTAGCGHALDCEKWRTECSRCSKVRGFLSSLYRDDARFCFRRMKTAFEGFENLEIASVSDWLCQRAKISPITRNFTHDVAYNGIDTNVFKPTEYQDLQERLRLRPEKKVVLYVTPSFTNPLKGSRYFLECANILKDYQFIVVGFNGDASVLPSNVLPVKFTQSKQELAAYYSMANCVLTPSLKETYSIVSAEAICCGTPVVAFKAGGIVEVVPQDMGECVDCYDVAQLVEAVRKWSNTNIAESSVEEARLRCSKETMCEKYFALYRQFGS